MHPLGVGNDLDGKERKRQQMVLLWMHLVNAKSLSLTLLPHDATSFSYAITSRRHFLLRR